MPINQTLQIQKAQNQQLQRKFFAKAVSIVLNFFTGTIKDTLSKGWSGITLQSSNIGVTSRILRSLYLSVNALENSYLLSSIKTGSLCSGLANFGNTILDEFQISQVGATAAFNFGVITATPGLKFFGSDIELREFHKISQTTNANGDVEYLDEAIGLTPQEVVVANTKAFGWYDTVDEVGNWNFVYRVATSAFNVDGTSFLTKYKGAGVHEAYVNVGFYTEGAEVYTSKVFYKELTVA